MTIRRTLTLAALAAAVIAPVGASAFTSLIPGGSVLVPDLGIPGGYSSIDYRVDNFIGTNALSQVRFTGKLQSFVFKNSTDNTLLFGYIVTNDATSADEIGAVAMTSFAGWTTEVGQDPNASLNSFSPATTAQRSANGNTISFQFTGGPIGRGTLAQGTDSYGLMIKTNATAYAAGTVSVLNGGVATVESFAPVPEPGTMVALGAGALALIRRRRKA